MFRAKAKERGPLALFPQSMTTRSLRFVRVEIRKENYMGDGSRHSYEKCIACGRVYFAYRSRLAKCTGRFCTRRCFWRSWKAFSRALAEGKLENILSLPVCQEVLHPRRAGTKEHAYERSAEALRSVW